MSYIKQVISSVWTWAATWQNQRNDCATSEDSDQPGHPHSLIRVSAVRMKKPWVLSYPMSAQRRLIRLIRLGRFPGWSVSSLGAHSFSWFCHVAAHILSPVTDNCPSWTSSREELFHDQYAWKLHIAGLAFKLLTHDGTNTCATRPVCIVWLTKPIQNQFRNVATTVTSARIYTYSSRRHF